MIAAFVSDLLFQSKIRAAASHSGAAVSFLRDPADPSLDAATLAIVDLDGPGAVATVSALAAARPALRLVGFVSHVNAGRIREARAAGSIDVMARSAFVNLLPSLMLPSPSDVIDAASRLSGKVVRTPLVRSAWLSSATGGDVWLKLENRQLEGSFKTRGALHALMRAGAARAVTASAGNHGRALAFAAKTLGVPLTVFAPATAPRAKLDPIRGHGAALELRDTYDEAERDAIAFARAGGIPYISPYNHPDVIAGAGTAGLEVLEDLPDAGMVIVPVGGGGLVSGIALAAAARGGRAVTAGVEAAASPVFSSALAAGHLVEVKVSPTLADGLAGNAEPGSITFDLIRDLRVGVQTVSEDDIAAAMRGLMAREGERVEGAGGVGVAALLSGAIDVRGLRAAVIVSGGNVDPETLQQQEPGAEAEQHDGQQRPEQHGHS